MKYTLYHHVIDIERMDKKLRILNSSNQIDVAELQRNLFQRYEGNPVLYDAMQGKQSIEESLEELGQVNRGIKKILPWKKNKEHNERLDQLGKLVSEPYHLHKSGTFMPDNLITTGAEVTAMAFGISYLLLKYLIAPGSDVTPEEIRQTTQFKTMMPVAMSAVMAPIIGFATNLKRFSKLPIEEARYLDEKVQELYAEKQQIKHVLETLAGGGSCDYAPVHGGLMLFDGKGGRVGKEVDISTFLKLESENLIDMKNSMKQGHMVFPSNVQVDRYGITEQGREYLDRQA